MNFTVSWIFVIYSEAPADNFAEIAWEAKCTKQVFYFLPVCS